jgi:hypothetical protein
VQEHERGVREALDQRLQVARVGGRQEQVSVAEARVHLHRQGPAGLLVGRERRAEDVAEARALQTVGAFRGPHGVEIEPAAIGGDRLQRREASRSRHAHLGANVLERIVEGLLGHPLDPQHRQSATPGQLAELGPADAFPGRRIAVVDEQHVRAGRAQQRGCVLVRVGLQPSPVDGVLGRGNAEERGQLGDRPTVCQARGDVRPLTRVVALRVQPAELVQRGPAAQDPVRVVIDEANVGQYFEK